MKLMRLAPLLSALALLAGSSAWAHYSYNVFNDPAIGAPACGTTVLQSPAIVAAGACGAVPVCGVPRAIDPFAPLWQQAVLDYNNTGLRVNDGLYASQLPLQFSQAAIAQPMGLSLGVLNQAAVIGNDSLSMPAAVGAVGTISQPMYIEAPNAFDVSLLQGNAVCASASAAPVQAAPEQRTITRTTTRTIRYVQPRIIKRHRRFFSRCFGRG